MLDSFTVISNELSTLAYNLKAAEEQRDKLRKEKELADANLAAAKAEAAAAEAAAAAAEEARRAAEAAAQKLREAAALTKIERVEKVESVQVISSSPVKPREPSPAKERIIEIVQELPQPKAPEFVIPLTDAVIQEGTYYFYSLGFQQVILFFIIFI